MPGTSQSPPCRRLTCSLAVLVCGITAGDSPVASRLHAADPQRQPQRAASAPETVYRPADTRPRHDDARAAALGIARYESTRLRLYTDIDPEVARTLPPLMDQAFAAWEEYFGPLPPARDGADWQMTGYIMADREKFQAAGMVPQQTLDLLVHGLHRGGEFWMNHQEYDYYLRHLMIHEGTHCFMTVLGGPRPPPWYMEGMAELFGTHHTDSDGRTTFGVMPEDRAQFVGFGRVEMLREELAAGRMHSAQAVIELTPDDFIASRREPYAWSWALCKFLDTHPRYQARFRELAQHVYDRRFDQHVGRVFAADASVLAVEWELFIRNLVYGYDIERAAIDFRRGVPLDPGATTAVMLESAAGWQSTGVWIDADTTCRVIASGEVSLANDPRPWISEPQGVSIRYAGGLPLGRVVAAIQSESPPDADGAGALWQVIDIGRSAEITPTVAGTLYLRVNDHWSELDDNEGTYSIQVSRP